ncbi:hypothetical protein QYM36_006532 [Artemia franciscana]|uniref:Uncharacterized protein n=1 Tax=Artemia franciscana TaxID=6661 RepID=A0AA88HXR3_ARTSF|nr:hypothetical protein QYM36_006532 [Artemia franciscana]
MSQKRDKQPKTNKSETFCGKQRRKNYKDKSEKSRKAPTEQEQKRVSSHTGKMFATSELVPLYLPLRSDKVELTDISRTLKETKKCVGKNKATNKRKMDNADTFVEPKTKKPNFNRSDNISITAITGEDLTLRKKQSGEKRYKNDKDKPRKSKTAPTEKERKRVSSHTGEMLATSELVPLHKSSRGMTDEDLTLYKNSFSEKRYKNDEDRPRKNIQEPTKQDSQPISSQIEENSIKTGHVFECEMGNPSTLEEEYLKEKDPKNYAIALCSWGMDDLFEYDHPRRTANLCIPTPKKYIYANVVSEDDTSFIDNYIQPIDEEDVSEFEEWVRFQLSTDF